MIAGFEDNTKNNKLIQPPKFENVPKWLKGYTIKNIWLYSGNYRVEYCTLEVDESGFIIRHKRALYFDTLDDAFVYATCARGVNCPQVFDGKTGKKVYTAAAGVS